MPFSWIVYMVRCSDGTLYTGVTNDLERRLSAHQDGTASKYTRARRPVELVFHEASSDRGAALRREAEIKRLTRSQKLELARASFPSLPRAGPAEP